MRASPKTSNIVPHPVLAACYGRRRLNPGFGDLTCLVLVRHGETAKALLVSDTGDRSKAVWCPKALLAIENSCRFGFLVATLSKRFAEQKGLAPRFIDDDGFSDETKIALDDASRRAARKRNLLRGHRAPMSRHQNGNIYA